MVFTSKYVPVSELRVLPRLSSWIMDREMEGRARKEGVKGEGKEREVTGMSKIESELRNPAYADDH